MKTQKYILVGFLVVSFAIVGTFLFQHSDNSGVKELPASNSLSSIEEIKEVSSETGEASKKQTTLVKGKVSLSIE
ncbi:hypothetical protein GW764_02160 [Candidatus Parcubacteria bacterium]|nr:hypothetical protein [Candidatus Parcubacteria bacterium]